MMQHKFSKRFLAFAFTVCALAAALAVGVFAETAADITDSVTIKATGLDKVSVLTDGSLSTTASGENISISIESEQPMGGLYIKYREIPTQGALNGSTPIAGYGFIHEYIPLDGAAKATLSYPKANIAEISVYAVGDLPEDVQVWEIGPDGTDLMLFSTHSDDDQLFFAGLIPYYVDKGVIVRVAYFVNHFDTASRTHELLDGLWHCGLKNYPIISPLPDGYSESIEGAEKYLQGQGFEHANILNLQRIFLNRYKPKVAILHDFKGEYGHGAHMLNTATFVEAVENPTNGLYLPEKIYVHLYKENPLVLDIDTPLESFDGKTAFQVSQEAFGYHKSQHWTWFYKWLYGKNGNITKASQIKSYNPANYGLYYSSVGEDTGTNDMLENVKTYGELQAEEEERQAELRRREEEQRLKEQEEYEADTVRLEEEARETERLAAEQRDKKQAQLVVSLSLLGTAVLVAILFFFVFPRKPRRRRKPLPKTQNSER